MPRVVNSEEELDFLISEASQGLKKSETITVRKKTIGGNQAKLKFRTKKRLFTYVVEQSKADSIAKKYDSVRAAN